METMKFVRQSGSPMRCMEGASWTDTRPDGSVCTHTCDNGSWQVECTPPPLKVWPGTLTPQYLIVTVVYSPPGRQGGASGTSVEYGSGSDTGIVVSGSRSFADDYGVSLEVGAGGVTGEVSFGIKRSTSDSASAEITKSTSTTIKVGGPPIDGIDHDRDLIWLLLSPKLKVHATEEEIKWSFDPTSPGILQYVYVGWLKNPASLPPGVRTALEGSGITEAEYPKLLSVDPYAITSPALDPRRYRPANYFLPYEPPFGPNDPDPSITYTIGSESVVRTGTETTTDITVGASLTGEAKFLEIITAKLKLAASWTWSTNSNTEESTKVSQHAAVTMAGPSFGYTGMTLMAVYYDTTYRTFLFIPQATAHGLAGRIISSGDVRAVIAGIRVVLEFQGETYTTFTTRRGDYRFPVNGEGDGRIRFANLPAETIPVGPKRTYDLHIR